MKVSKIFILTTLICTLIGMGITTFPANACIPGTNGCGTHTVNGDYVEAGHPDPNSRFYYYRVTFSYTYDGSEVTTATATGSSGTIWPWYGGQSTGYPIITYGNPTIINGYASFGELGSNGYDIHIIIWIYPSGSATYAVTGYYDYINSNF